VVGKDDDPGPHWRITNVREDHQDVMGVTLPEIAVSLRTCAPPMAISSPPSATSVAGYPEARGRAPRLDPRRRGPARVRSDEIVQFDYLAFRDNVAIGLAVADLLGIDRETATRGMIKAKGDVGVVRLQHVALVDKPICGPTSLPSTIASR